MLESQEKIQGINRLVTEHTTRHQFLGILAALLNPGEIEKLGGVEVAAHTVTESLAYLSVHAPAQFVFDKYAFTSLAAADLSEGEGDVVWEILKRIGVLVSEPARSPEHYSISRDLVSMLANPENQFFTEE